MIDRKWTALKITLIYLVFGFGWIFFTDRALELAGQDMILWLSTIKGLVYVIVTGILIYFLVYFHLKKVVVIEKELNQQNTELQNTQKRLRQMAYYDYLTGFPNRMSLYENFRDFSRNPSRIHASFV